MAGPLAGLKVLEMVGVGPAPFGAMMLADAGAEVLRIHPKGVPPAIPTMNTSYDVLARGRRSVALDLKKPGGPANGVRPAIRPGEYFQQGAYREGRRHYRWPELLLAWVTYWRVRLRGGRGADAYTRVS